MKGTVEASTQDAKTKAWRPVTEAHPGDVIKYRLAYKNEGTAPAVGFVLNNRIPAGTHLNAVPTATNCRLEFSADGGATFSEKPTRVANGKTVPVPPEKFTNLRCTQTPKLISPGQVVATDYFVKVE